MRRVAVLIVVGLIGFTALSGEAAPQDSRGPVAKHKSLKVMPRGHQRVVYKGNPYYYTAGRFYRQTSGVYVAITAPLGAAVLSLPGGFVTLGIGPNRYFHYAGVYYRHASNGYVVIERPSDAPEVMPINDEESPLVVYPAGEQTEEQRGRDRYECHVWASSETGFDPTSSESAPNLKSSYQRAMGACLEARNYVVK